VKEEKNHETTKDTKDHEGLDLLMLLSCAFVPFVVMALSHYQEFLSLDREAREKPRPPVLGKVANEAVCGACEMTTVMI